MPGRVEIYPGARVACKNDCSFQKTMSHPLLIAAVALTFFRSARHWIFHIGALGFIPLGLLDGSIIPVPGSMDVLTIVLSARDSELWIYYALMATVGSVIGGFVTYRLARKGGKQMLERRIAHGKLKKVFAIFERWGFGAIAISALLPPPFPVVPFVLAAGAMQYPARKFLAALTLGRAVRFLLLGFLAARYGRGVLAFVTQHGHPVLLTVITVIVVATAAFFIIVGIRRGRQRRAQA
jgi:membrane protein YqaA with SNARE-associated domain